MSRQARIARRRAHRAGTVQDLPEWLVNETSEHRSWREWQERGKRRRAEGEGREYVPYWQVNPEAEPVYSDQGLILGWELGESEQADLESRLEAVELEPSDWINDAAITIVLDNDEYGRMSAPEQLDYLRAHHPEFIEPGERAARVNALNRRTHAGRIFDGPPPMQAWR